MRWLALAWALALPVAASAQNADLESLRVERTDEGLLLSARLNIRLPGAVEEALDKGIPIHFVADATVMRERWYWTDQRVSASQRYMRVAYMPLTRRWRLNTSSEPLTNADPAKRKKRRVRCNGRSRQHWKAFPRPNTRIKPCREAASA